MELFGRELSLKQMIGLVECQATPDEDLVHRAAVEIIAALRKSQRMERAAVEEDKIHQWVNVKDKLPDEEGTDVLVASTSGFVGEAQYYNGAWHSGRSGVMDSVPGKVTHWMELPELPEQ